MYRVKANILSDDLMIIEDRAEILITNPIGFAPITVYGGTIDIEVPNDKTMLEINVFGYAKKTISAKDVNELGTVYMNPAVSVIANPIKPKKDNTLLFILGAVGLLGIGYFINKKPTPKVVKIS